MTRASWTTIIALALFAPSPALAADLTYDQLTVPVPSGWTTKKVGEGSKEMTYLIPPGGHSTGGAIVLPSWKMGKLELGKVLDIVLTHSLQGAKGLKASPVSEGKTDSGLALAFKGQASKDAQGQVRLDIVYAFRVGERVQVIMVVAKTEARLAELMKALEPSLKGTKKAPEQKREEVRSLESVRFSRLTFPLPSGWLQKTIGADKSRRLVLTPPKQKADAAVILFPGFAQGTQELTAIAKTLLGNANRGRTPVRTYPPKGPIRLKTGPSLVIHINHSRDPKTNKERFSIVYLFGQAGSAQAVYVLASNLAVLKAVTNQLEPNLGLARLMVPGVAAGASPEIDRPASSSFHDQGVLGSTSIAAVPRTAKLTPIPHEIQWHYRWDINPQNHALWTGTDKWGDMFAVVADRFHSWLQDRESKVQQYPKRSRKGIWTPFTLPSVKQMLKNRLGKGPSYGWEPYSFEQLDTDRNGNLYGRVGLYYTDYPVIAQYRWDTKQTEMVVSPWYLAKIAREMKLDSYVSARYAFKPTPQGDNAWLFVYDRWKSPSYNPKNPKVRIQFLTRKGPHNWTAKEVRPRFFTHGGKYGVPTHSAIRWGAPDWQGGWVFYTGRVLWRMYHDGTAWPLATFRLGSGGVKILNPVVLENGDVWFAINKVISHGSHTDFLNETHMWVLVGDRSRLVRIRLDGKGGVQLGEISGDTLIASLEQAGAKMRDTSLLKNELDIDYKSGGLFGHEYKHHTMFYVLKPKD